MNLIIKPAIINIPFLQPNSSTLIQMYPYQATGWMRIYRAMIGWSKTWPWGVFRSLFPVISLAKIPKTLLTSCWVHLNRQACIFKNYSNISSEAHEPSMATTAGMIWLCACVR